MSELTEGIEVASAVAAAIREAAALWDEYKAGNISAAVVLAKIAAGRAAVTANRTAEDQEIADYEAKFDTSGK